MPKKTEVKNVDPNRSPETVQEMLNSYLVDGVIGDFGNIEPRKKMILFQNTPPKYIKKRSVGGQMIPYTDHFYIESAFNFIFNFDWNFDVLESKEREYKNAKGKTIFEVILKIKYSFNYGKKKIERTIYSGHTYFENPATNRGDAYKSALSKGHSTIASTFGIGSDVKRNENDVIKKLDAIVIEPEGDGVKVDTAPPKKTPKKANDEESKKKPGLNEKEFETLKDWSTEQFHKGCSLSDVVNTIEAKKTLTKEQKKELETAFDLFRPRKGKDLEKAVEEVANEDDDNSLKNIFSGQK